MKPLLKLLGGVLTVITVIIDIAELLALPALFAIIGILNSYPWQYYAISIGGYFVILIIIEIVCHFVFRFFDKKYTPLLERFFIKLFHKDSDES